jgi:hypothetical protein
MPTNRPPQTGAVLARLHLGNKRCFLTAVRINIDIVTAATKPRGAAQWIALAVDANRLVRGDDLAFTAERCVAPNLALTSVTSLGRLPGLRTLDGHWPSPPLGNRGKINS